MKKLLSLIIAVVFMSSGLAIAQNKTTYKDSSGRNVGSSRTDSSGKTTYSTPSGQNAGSSRTDSSGKTTYSTPSGQNVGSSRTSKR